MNAALDLLRAPAWPILLWSGFAASLAAALILPPGTEPAGRESTRWPLTLALGVAFFAPLYGLTFEALGRADLFLGGAFGLAHGLFAIAVSLTRTRPPARHSLRRLAGWLAYGLVLGFLYPVPAA